jgi:N-acetylmuramoyl-L-alanine amidase
MKQLKQASLLLLALLVTSCSYSRTVIEEKNIPKKKNTAAGPTLTPPTIVLDAGHGGKDLGTHPGDDKKEKESTLQTVLFLDEDLRAMGYRTILTRGEDIAIPLKLRASFANSNRARLFVSIHFNAAKSQKAEGIEVYYFNAKDNKVKSLASKELADIVLKRMIAATGSRSRGVKHGNFAVIRDTKMPAILIEGGFMTNEAERKKIKDKAYLKKLADSIAKGVQDYLRDKS